MHLVALLSCNQLAPEEASPPSPCVVCLLCAAQIAGNVPDRIGLLASLESLNLASNQFTGTAAKTAVLHSYNRMAWHTSRLLDAVVASAMLSM
jgi:hypothetical protein